MRVAGFDLTFSAPKSVSVLFGLGDRETREAIRAAHDRAVREAFGHVERAAAAVRRGHGGARVEPASGLVAAAFRHRTSRAGDPQLHTHVLVANLGQGPDGRWSALEIAELLEMKRSTVEDYARRGLLPSVKLGRHRRFVRSDVEDALTQLRNGSSSCS